MQINYFPYILFFSPIEDTVKYMSLATAVARMCLQAFFGMDLSH